MKYYHVKCNNKFISINMLEDDAFGYCSFLNKTFKCNDYYVVSTLIDFDEEQFQEPFQRLRFDFMLEKYKKGGK